MSEEFPIFKYHPNPLETKNITESTVKCICCEQSRGFIYVASVYARGTYDDVICPWCIADGSAAKKLDATFCSDIDGEIAAEIVDEVIRRTPGYISWQGEQWQTHCGDACEFHGDVSKSEMNNLENRLWLSLDQSFLSKKMSGQSL